MMGEILQLDKIDFKPLSRHEKITILKKAFTPKAIKEIHEAIPLLWPDKKDYLRCLNEEKKSNSGLFIGTYVSDVIGPLLNKYSLYEDTIYLIDPILDHRTLRDKHNPYIHPEQYIVITFQYVWLWFELAPWIKSGIVKVIRNYGDFDYALEKECVETAESRFEEFPDLQKLLECEETTGNSGGHGRQCHPQHRLGDPREQSVGRCGHNGGDNPRRHGDDNVLGGVEGAGDDERHRRHARVPERPSGTLRGHLQAY